MVIIYKEFGASTVAEREIERRGENRDLCSSDDATAAAATLVAGNDGSSSSISARPVFSISMLARAGLVVAEVVRHLHRVHQRGAAAVFSFGFGDG